MTDSLLEILESKQFPGCYYYNYVWNVEIVTKSTFNRSNHKLTYLQEKKA